MGDITIASTLAIALATVLLNKDSDTNAKPVLLFLLALFSLILIGVM